jgi:hypothetical protein
MSYTDFFSEFQNRKDKSKKIFESIDIKIKKDPMLDEALFGLFNKKSNVQNDQMQSGQTQSSQSGETQDSQIQPVYELVKEKNGLYYFGDKNRKTATIDNAQSQIDTYDWKNSPLKWLFEPGLKFELNSIAFDFKRGIILNVKSINWEGPFFGNTFTGVFKGSAFKGNFLGSNDDYQAHPTTFIEGAFSDSTRTGLLGLPDVTDANQTFNLIQVPVGYSIEILTNNQIRHTITVNKKAIAAIV